jgi:PA domain
LYFDPQNPNACNEFKERTFDTDADGDITPFFIAERGGCSFVKKARNMENIGVAVAIIVDNNEENVDNIIMSDDGTGGGIRIPSMLIGKTDGKKLIDFIKTSSNEEIKQVAIMADFIMDKPDNRVEYDIWFTSSNDRALDFITDFKNYDSKLSESVLMTPHYVFWRCTFCE